MLRAHIRRERTGRPVCRLLARNDIHRGTRGTGELRRDRERAPGLGDRKRRVLSRLESGLDILKRLARVELRRDAVDEHGTCLP